MKNQPKCIKATQNIGIFTDSLSNLKQIEKGIATGTEQRNLFEILNQKQNKMTFYHTKSHIGIKKNEEVDELCSTNKSDIDRVKLVQHGERTVMQVKESMNKAMTQIRLDNLKKQAINSKSARLYKNTLDKLKEPPKQHKDLPRKAGVLLTKARVNRWTSCQVFLKRINVRENHNCIICQEKDTTKHQLDKCKRHEERREILKAKLKYKYRNITEMLLTTNVEETKLLIEYLIAIDNDTYNLIQDQSNGIQN